MKNFKSLSTGKKRYKIILADPQPITLHGLRQAINDAALRIEKILEVDDISNIPNNIIRYKPDIVIAELLGHGKSILEALHIINNCIRNWPDIPFVVCTSIEHPLLFKLLIAMNVNAIYLKTEPTDSLIYCLEKTLNGFQEFSPMVSNALMKIGKSSRIPLTEKEFDVLMLVLSGKNVTEISRHLYRDVRTVSSHKRSAMRKLGVKGDAEMFSSFNLIEFGL